MPSSLNKVRAAALGAKGEEIGIGGVHGDTQAHGQFPFQIGGVEGHDMRVDRGSGIRSRICCSSFGRSSSFSDNGRDEPSYGEAEKAACARC